MSSYPSFEIDSYDCRNCFFRNHKLKTGKDLAGELFYVWEKIEAPQYSEVSAATDEHSAETLGCWNYSGKWRPRSPVGICQSFLFESLGSPRMIRTGRRYKVATAKEVAHV